MLDLPVLRHALATTVYHSGKQIMQAAVRDGEPGALQVVLLATQIRVNRRTRRYYFPCGLSHGIACA